MTIRKGEPWGTEVARPDDLVVVDDDHRLAELLGHGEHRPIALVGGDLHRTLGGRPLGDRTTLLAVPVDLVSASLDGGPPRPVVAHLVARSPWWAGSWWTGTVVVVMNAEFHGSADVAPRGHPNDGRVETLTAERMALRQRLEVRRRLASGSHLPHPDIETRSVRRASWEFRRPRAVFLDGVRGGTARRLDVEVVADAGVVHV